MQREHKSFQQMQKAVPITADILSRFIQHRHTHTPSGKEMGTPSDILQAHAKKTKGNYYCSRIYLQ